MKKAKRLIIWYEPTLKEKARELRNNSTKPEIILWLELKGKSLGYDFHRQKPINYFIVDFFCQELMLAIEIDGKGHNWDENLQNDIQRDKKLAELGITVFRFSNTEIFNELDKVLYSIVKFIEMRNKTL